MADQYNFHGDEDELRQERETIREEYRLQQADEWYDDWRLEAE